MNVVLLGAVIAIGLGAFFAYGLPLDRTASTLTSNAYMTGHVTLTAYDENGNVKAYRQTDNIVVNKGDDCMADLIFQTTGTDPCTQQQLFDVVHIGTGSDGSTAETDVNPLPITCTTSLNATTSAVTAAAAAGGSSTLLTTAFLNVGANIDEAALKDSVGCGNGNPLAYQQFTEIPLGANDDLTVEWTITIDGN